MPNLESEGLISIEDAAEKYSRNRSWWYRQITEGKITGYEIPGLRGTYLRTEDVEALLRPRPRSSDADKKSG